MTIKSYISMKKAANLFVAFFVQDNKKVPNLKGDTMLKIERIYTKPLDLDGYRILVDRLWARGISKVNAKLDAWPKEIAPSSKLRMWFKHEDAKFAEFKQKYIQELNANPNISDFIKLVQAHLKQGNVILLYGAKNTHHNNAVVLRSYLNQKLHLNQKVDASFLYFLYNDGYTNRAKELLNDANWLQKHRSVTKKYDLRVNELGKFYHGPSKKVLDHQALMSIVKK